MRIRLHERETMDVNGRAERLAAACLDGDSASQPAFTDICFFCKFYTIRRKQIKIGVREGTVGQILWGGLFPITALAEL